MDKKLLIIEDDPYIMRALSSILEIEGYALDCVTTGADALSKARSDPLDLFLLDLGLPDMDGLQVIQQLRTQTRRPIIILSARAQENEKALSMAYAAERAINETYGIRGMVMVRSMRGLNLFRWMLRRRQERRGSQRPRLREVV